MSELSNQDVNTMPKREINEIMQPERSDTKHVDRMRHLLEPGKEAPKILPARVVAPVKKTFVHDNPYQALGVDKASMALISETARLMGGNVGDKQGHAPVIIGGAGKGNLQHNLRIGPVEWHTIRLIRVARTTGKWPDDCPDPLFLARVVIQQWYAQWGPELEAATGVQPAKPEE